MWFRVQILDNNLALVSIKNSEPISSQKYGRTQACASFSICDRSTSFIICVEGEKFIATTVDVTTNKNVALARIMLIVHQGSRCRANSIRLGLLSDSSERSNGDIIAAIPSGVIPCEEFPASNVVKFVSRSVVAHRGTFSFELENNHT